MVDLQFHVQLFWVPVVLYGMAMWLVLSIPKLSGKRWLIAFLLTRIVGGAFTYVLQLLMRGGVLTAEQYRDFVTSGTQGIVNIVGYARLFVHRKRPAERWTGAQHLEQRC